jgi:DNA-binding MarR family transcriptional regulator
MVITPAPRTLHRGGSVAFLLAQLGAYAAERFASRITDLELTPPQAGLLRMIATAPGENQLSYAKRLGMPPSRFVAFVDELQERGLLQRRRGGPDRRAYQLLLTGNGTALLQRLGSVGRDHEDELCRSLTKEERETLRALLERMANEQGLTPGVHPGYRHLR